MNTTVDEIEPLLGPAINSKAFHSGRKDRPLEYQHLENLNSDGDLQNPREWPEAFKWGVTMLLTLLAFSVTFNCIAVVPIASRIISDLSCGEPKSEVSRYASVLIVTIWELGEAAGPLVISPLSEAFGRRPVMNIGNTLFVIATIVAAASQTVPMFVLARALSGLVVTCNVLNPAVVGDMFDPNHRGSPMNVVMLSPLIGSAVGPTIGGAIADHWSWRWVLWIAAILAGTGQLLFLTCFRETYKITTFRGWHTHIHKTSNPNQDSHPQSVMSGKRHERNLLMSIVRPFIIFGSSGILMLISLFGAVVFAQFYNIATTLPAILGNEYGLSSALTGSAMIPFTIGSVISVFICNLTLDRIYARLKHVNGGVGHPEYRLPLAIVGAFTLPIAITVYGWSAELHLPLAMMLFSVGFIGVSLMLAYGPLSTYIVDAFDLYSASAMTGLIVVRCLIGTFLPLLTTPLVESFGYGWGFTLIAALSSVLAPIPVIVLKYGEHWRQRCEFTKTP